MKIKILFLLLITILIIVSGCFFGTTVENTVTPTIRAIGLPDASTVGSVTLKVTGPDMDPVEMSYSELPSVINIAIPGGNNRTFELSVGLAPAFIAASPGVATSYKGTATANITSNSAVVTLNMGIGSTKLIVPDYQNHRILQFDNISDTTSFVLNYSNTFLGPFLTSKSIGTFNPYDVDSDNQGRIYIANNGGGTGEGIIIRVDNITGSNPFQIGSGSGGSIIALTIDRKNGLVYYTDGSLLYRSNLNGMGEVSLTTNAGVANIGIIRGLAIADSGIIYIAGNTLTGAPTVFQYNPNTQLVTAGYNSTNLVTPWDAMAKDGFVYVANLGGANGWKIIQLNDNLTSPVGYGISTTTSIDTTQDHFYGPRRFVAILNKKITIIDDSDGGGSYDKLVSIDNITGANWKTLPASGDGQGLFSFYSYC